MRVFSISLYLLAAQIHSQGLNPADGNQIPEPKLTDYSQADRTPGIMGVPEDVQDADGNPTSL